MNVDVLSRHVAAVVRKNDTTTDVKPQKEVVLSKEFIKQAQRNVDFCQQVSQALSQGKEIGYLWDQDMVLYHQSPSTSEELKIEVPALLREQIVRQHHEPLFAGHQREKRTLNSLRLHYFWPNISKDFENFIQKMHSCAKLKSGRIPLAPLGELPET